MKLNKKEYERLKQILAEPMSEKHKKRIEDAKGYYNKMMGKKTEAQIRQEERERIRKELLHKIRILAEEDATKEPIVAYRRSLSKQELDGYYVRYDILETMFDMVLEEIKQGEDKQLLKEMR